MEDRTCVVCGLSFTPSRTGSVCCSRACWASRGVPECSVDGCNKPNRARGLCAAHWMREHGKKAEPQETACSVCGVIVVRYSVKHLVRAGWGRPWPQSDPGRASAGEGPRCPRG